MNELYIKTPLIESLEMGEIIKSQVYLKMENVQQSGSFKNRGIGSICSYYAQVENAKCFVVPSGGNAGLAIAYAGKILKVPVKVIIPKSSPLFMADRIRREGGEVILEGENWDATNVFARELATKPGYCFIHPFDHPLVWKGNATIIHEIKESGLKPDAIAVAVGGGGLFCGIIQGLHEVGWNDVPCFTAETEGAAAFAKSVKEGRLITLDKLNTIATSLAAKTVTPQALEWSKVHPVFPQIVTDKQAVEATLRFADHHRTLVEPACGAALSLIYEQRIDPQVYKKIVVIVCGGSAVTRALQVEWAKKTGSLL